MEGNVGCKGTIFIVVNAANIRESLTAALELDGYRVRPFVDGESLIVSALLAARVGAPACIIIDLHLRGRCGLDMLTSLNAWHYPAPIIMISKKWDFLTGLVALRRGASELIEEPVQRETIAAEVREIIDTWTPAPGGGRASLEWCLQNYRGRHDKLRAVLTRLTEGHDGMRHNSNALWREVVCWNEVCKYEEILYAVRKHVCDFLNVPGALEAKQEIGLANDNTDLLSKPFPGHDLLTPRERVVLAQIVNGATSKEASQTLGISLRTVEFHRTNIMQKLCAKNTADLVRLVLGGG